MTTGATPGTCDLARAICPNGNAVLVTVPTVKSADSVDSRRDEVVQAAIDAGLSKSEVHRLTGIARTTIDRIVGALPAMKADPR